MSTRTTASTGTTGSTGGAGSKKGNAGGAIGALVLVLGGFAAVIVLSGRLAVPWLAWLDTWVADGDRRLLAIVVVAWCWLLVVPIALAAEVRRRHGNARAVPLWALVGLGVLPVFAFVPGRGSGTDRGEEVAAAAIDDPSLGGDLAWVAFGGLPLVIGMVVVVAGSWQHTGTRGRAFLWGRRLAVWTVLWGAIAGILATTVDSYGSRGDWLATSARELAGPSAGTEGITDGFQVGLAASRTELVSCDEAAEALAVDGGTPPLDGCRSALLVEAVGRVGAGAARTDTGSLVAVVLQTRTEGALDDLDAALDDVELVPGAGLPEPPGDTLATPARAALALVIAAEDPGEAPVGDDPASAEARPLTRALAYVLIGTSQGWYLAPPEV